MKITIVMGFFLPVPPDAGGATEKCWHLLGGALARRGHDVTIVSRQWSDWPVRESRDGVRHLRLPGYDHHRSLAVNLFHDFRWSRRVLRHLPEAGVTVCNAVTLPLWLGRQRPANRVVVMPGRIPKGQFRWYGRIDRVLTVSASVEAAILRENPRLAPVLRRFGYPVADEFFAPAPAVRREEDHPLTIGYVGRVHPEKGLDLLADALALLARKSDLPRWRFVLCGPSDVRRGGAGSAYAAQLERRLVAACGRDRVAFREPVFGDAELAKIYRDVDVFCYPSVADRGETFGLAVVEAMASGAVPVVSQLACFTEFVSAGSNGEVFDHRTARAASDLADKLGGLLLDPTRREAMVAAARKAAERYNVNLLALRLTDEFSTLK